MTTEEAVARMKVILVGMTGWKDESDADAIRTVLAALDEQTKRLEDSFVRELDAQADAAALREALTRARAFVDRWPLSEVCDAALASTGGTALLERVKRLEVAAKVLHKAVHGGCVWKHGSFMVEADNALDALARLDGAEGGAT